jgi:MOSC domain-containing protein YiiM
VDKNFSVGAIQLRGIRLCEPCDYLAGRTDPRVKLSMTHRGGLRADILSEGIIHIDDPIIPSSQEHR